MSDLKQRLRKLDLAQAPDVWPDASSRIVTPSEELEQQRRNRGSRIATAAVALAVFLAAAVFAQQAFRPAPTTIGSSSPTPPPGRSIYTDPLGWTAFYPSDWSVTSLQQTSDGLGAGVTIQNLAFMRTSTVPDGVALSITHPLNATPDPSAGSSSFPLSVNDFKVNPGPSNASVLEFRIDGVPYVASLRVDAAASSADVAAMDEVIASIRPPSSPASPATPIGSVQTIDVGWDESESSTALTSSQGFAWVSGYHHSSLIDQAGESTPLPFKQGPNGLSSASSATWAVGFEPGTGSYVARFEPGSATPDLTIPMGDFEGSTVVATDTAVWVFGYERGSDGNLGTLIRLDPNTGSIEKKLGINSILPAGMSSDAILYAAAADDAAAWLSIAEIRNGELGATSLVRLDSSTYETTAYDPGPIPALVAGDGAAWLPGAHGPVRLDPVTGRSTQLDIPDEGAYPFAASQDAVWFLGGSATTVELFRLDLVDGEPAGVGLNLSVDRGRLWGSVDASFDGAGSVWLLYESGPLQEVQVGG